MNFSKRKIKTLSKSAGLRNEEEESWNYPEIVEKKKKKKTAKPIDIDYLLSTEMQIIQPDLRQEPRAQADVRDITMREYEPEPQRSQELTSIYDGFGPMEFPRETATKPSTQLAPETTIMSQLRSFHSPKAHQATPAEVLEPFAVPEPLTSIPPPQEATFQHVMAKKTKTNAELWHVNREKLERKKFYRINKKSLDIFEKVEDYSTLINTIDRLPDFVFVDHFVTRPEEFVLGESQAHDDRSVASRVGSTNLASNPTTLSLEVQSIGELPSIPQKRSSEQDNTVSYAMPLLANELAFTSPSKRPKVVTVEEVRRALEPEGLSECGSLKEHTLSRRPVVSARQALEQEVIRESQQSQDQQYAYAPAPSKSPRRLEFGIPWAGRIMNALAIHPKLKPIELCSALNENPTKLNMARIFVAVLVLAKHQHVCLFPKENTTELEFIEYGPVQFDSLLW